MRDLIVLLDGTWNEPENASDTNTVRLRRLVTDFVRSRNAQHEVARMVAPPEPRILYELEAAAWRFYRTQSNKRLPAEWHALRPYMHKPGSASIACLGAFDTVGALGVPIGLFWRLNRDKFQFRYVELSGISKFNLHALAQALTDDAG
jgi:hypothetical protein